MLLRWQLDACIGFEMVCSSHGSLHQQAVLLQLLSRFQESADSDAYLLEHGAVMQTVMQQLLRIV